MQWYEKCKFFYNNESHNRNLHIKALQDHHQVLYKSEKKNEKKIEIFEIPIFFEKKKQENKLRKKDRHHTVACTLLRRHQLVVKQAKTKKKMKKK